MPEIRQLLVLLITVLLIASCGSSEPQTENSPVPITETPVSETPASETPASETPASPAEGYPAPAEETYPAPQEDSGYPEPSSNIPEGPAFSMTEPVRTSDAQVIGTGRPGVPIKLVDVTQAGQTLGEATINDDGSYSFDVAGKLVAQNRISLILGNIEGTSFSRDQFLRGPGYQDHPFIGVMFATTIVTE